MTDPNADTPAPRLVRWGYPLLGVLLFLIYLPTLARGATFSDGPELVSAIRAFGVAHPTGYPIFILAGHAFAKVLPDVIPYIVKIELFNALCGAVGCVFAAHAARAMARMVQKPDDDPRDADVAGLVTAFLLGVSTMLWGQVHIPEVYALHFLLCTWAGYFWVRFEQTRREVYVLGAALPMGMGLAHHVTMVYMLPAALVYLLARRPVFLVAWITTPVQRIIRLVKPGFREGKELAPWWGFLAANVIGFLPLLSYAYLMWASKHSAGIPWGDTTTWDNLYNHFTGRQYQGFMHKLDLMAHLQRIKVIPDIFDQQFLPVGTVMFLPGLFLALRRATRLALFFLVFLLLNAAHGVHYGVGDYGTYYIPGFYCCAVFMAAGLTWLIRVARTRAPEVRAPFGLGALGAMLVTATVTISIYARFTRRLPGWLAAHPLRLTVPLGVLAVIAFGVAVAVGRRRLRLPALPAWGLPALLAAGIFVPVIPAAISRAVDISDEATVGESYARELGSRIPKGAVLLTQGDGFLFSMWYANHVLDLGRDFATLDIANVRTPWFYRYVKSHHPVSCDPLGPDALRDPAAWTARCDTFEKRLKLSDKDTWINLELIGNRKPFPGVAATNPQPVRGADARCAEKKFADEHVMKECRCYGYGKRAAAQEGMLEEDCVMSAEEVGVVPREPIEIFAQRILEDYLDERPVFERNVLTLWNGMADNPRGWEGPAYQRISADWALVNRGRFNQLVWSADIAGFDPCAGDTLRELPLRPSGRVRATPRGADRRKLYKPNPNPTLLGSSWLAKTPGARDDASTRVFGASDPVIARLDWFEKFHWDASKADKRGGPIHHAVRLCVFDPSGRKVATQLVKAGPAQHDPATLLAAGPHAPGKWRFRACDAGEIGTGPLAAAADNACTRPILDYDFTVEPAESPALIRSVQR